MTTVSHTSFMGNQYITIPIDALIATLTRVIMESMTMKRMCSIRRPNYWSWNCWRCSCCLQRRSNTVYLGLRRCKSLKAQDGVSWPNSFIFMVREIHNNKANVPDWACLKGNYDITKKPYVHSRLRERHFLRW